MMQTIIKDSVTKQDFQCKNPKSIKCKTMKSGDIFSHELLKEKYIATTSGNVYQLIAGSHNFAGFVFVTDQTGN